MGVFVNTTAIIAQQTSTGFRGIHCFQNGSPDQIGKTVQRFYRKKKKVDLLILGGNLVFLGQFLKTPKGNQPGSITEFVDRDRRVAYQDYFFVLFQSQLLSQHVDWVYVFLQNKTWIYHHRDWDEWKRLC